MPGTSAPSASSRAGRPRPGRTRRVFAVIVLTAAVVTAVLALGRDTTRGGTATPPRSRPPDRGSALSRQRRRRRPDTTRVSP